ncbi:pantothenate kinase 1 [Gossypium australe]|uniref:Pantothenate kinase 1 n=1 Tax=Gossypium australe TaxID=47621 RepID=A0A5B6V0G1_9ROSI|nr:pantothenate kinase 1 [Gossypium australe]
MDHLAHVSNQPNSQPQSQISHLALDIGGSLIKLVYFCRYDDSCRDDDELRSQNESLGSKSDNSRPVLGGKLHFAKFETSKINDCLEFIHSMKLHLGGTFTFASCNNHSLEDIPTCARMMLFGERHLAWLTAVAVLLQFLEYAFEAYFILTLLKPIFLSMNVNSGFHDCTAPSSDKIFIKATGGGAYKFADLFKEKLGVSLDKEDEMECLVTGANFLLKAVHQEAFTYLDGQKEFAQIDPNDLYPYLLVNIGSGVSMIKVDGDGKFERVSGTSLGGGTFWGLGRLLTKCKNFDELLELSHQGNNRVIDMLVGDIYGGTDYAKIGLSATTIASSFGKAISDNKELVDYKPEDISRSLLRMISNNIGQVSFCNGFLAYGKSDVYPKILFSVKLFDISLLGLGEGSPDGFSPSHESCQYFDYTFLGSKKKKLRFHDFSHISYLNALRFGLKRIFFAGFFIRGHAYTMDTISVAVNFWSKGEAEAMFLRHEGFLGALGAFMSYEKQCLDDLTVNKIPQRFPISVSSAGNKIYCSMNGKSNDNESIECTVYRT